MLQGPSSCEALQRALQQPLAREALADPASDREGPSHARGCGTGHAIETDSPSSSSSDASSLPGDFGRRAVVAIALEPFCISALPRFVGPGGKCGCESAGLPSEEGSQKAETF